MLERSLQLRKLTEVSRALTYTVSLEEVLELTVNRAVQLLEAKKAVLMLMNPEGLLSVRASYGLDPSTCQAFQEPLQETLIHRLQNLLGDIDKDHFLGVPLVVGGDVTGILAVARPPLAEDAEEEEWLLSALADQAAVALEKTRLDETAEFRERLMGIVGHDLRNPLQAIKMGADFLLRREVLAEPEAKTVRRIASSALRMEEMIAQLLDFTRSRLGGGIPLFREPVHLNFLCRQVLDELELAQPAAELMLLTQGEPSGAWDRQRLTQVLSNLVANALQHGAKGRPVRVSTRLEGRDAVVDIHNEGVPIALELIPHLFDPFRQGQQTLHSNTSLGLGLYIAERIVRAHDGTLKVCSSAQEGTTFTVKIPCEGVAE